MLITLGKRREIDGPMSYLLLMTETEIVAQSMKNQFNVLNFIYPNGKKFRKTMYID